MKALKKYILENNICNSEDLAEKLLSDFGIKCRVEEDQRGEELFTFKYDQINSPKSSDVVQECRGIILDKEMKLVFKGFNRFFNAGEMIELTDKFDWNDFEAFEKADGSLIKIYYSNGFWQIGTNGTALGQVGMNTDGWDGQNESVFRYEVLKCLGYESEEDFQLNARKSFFDHLGYVFEFISPKNRIVTPYDVDQMVLLSVFKSGAEQHWDVVKEELQDMLMDGLNVRLAERWEVASKSELYNMVENLEGLQEGFVLRDKNGMRLKVKSDLYVAAHRMRGEQGLTLKKACELVLMGEHPEYLAYFPDDKENVMKVVECMEEYLRRVDSAYELHSATGDKKEFALAIKDVEFKHLLFTMRRDSCSAKESFYKMLYGAQLKTLMHLVGE